MDSQVIGIYCICDEVLKTLGIRDDIQCKMSTAEVMTFAVLAATHYKGNYYFTRLACRSLRYFPRILSLSRLVRRIHSVGEGVWRLVAQALQVFLSADQSQHFIVDSFPVKAYENHKSFRARIFSEKAFHGYSASKKQYFFGIKVHMIVDSEGIPIEFCFTPGSTADISALKQLSLDLPEKSLLFGDKAYTDYHFEDDLSEMLEISLVPRRKNNMKRQHSDVRESLLRFCRNRIETVFSSIVSRMPRWIQARTERGFCLKVFLFILAYMTNLLFPID